MNDFLRKISPVLGGKTYLIPAPKLSAEQRAQRRLSFRNENFLYKRKSDKSGKEMISCFHPDSQFTVYAQNEWWSDGWDAMDYGREFDFGRGFFEQFYDLMKEVPRPGLSNNKSENSEYCHYVDGNKNCYLYNVANDSEDCMYGSYALGNTDVLDTLWVTDSELCYECTECRKCYNVRHAQNCEGCVDGMFLLNCRGVKNCLLCVNLVKKEYHILNEPVSKEEYERMLAEIAGSYEKHQEMLRRFEELKRRFPVRKALNLVNCENCSGDHIFGCKNVQNSYDIYDSIDICDSNDALNSSDCRDCFSFDKTELCYESVSLMGYGYRFTIGCRDGSELFYCDNCHACKNCFGCSGLRNKQYCIFNKQYSQEEYERLFARIIEHMDARGEWGEFFPTEYSTFAYNETIAQDYWPLNKEVLENSWGWREDIGATYQPQTASLPDNIMDTDEAICKEVLACEVTGKNYKIVPGELKFYKKMKLPVPRRCPDQRRLDRLALRNPRRLWERECAKCKAKIQTSYSPERPETVYCERCYLAEYY